jgi:LexA-binding, inner membrane-associated putative hydrolase
MFVGHYAAAFVAKRLESSASLGTYVLAAMLADLAWCLFLLVGIEHVQFKPGSGAANYLAAWDVPWSHSLLMGVVWAALLTAIYAFGRRDPRAARILFAVVVSHWVLDVITDWEMPLAPGVRQTFGFGLWASVPATLVVEGGFWLAAIVLYLRATRPKTRTGVLAFWVGIAVLTALWYQNITGPPPPDARTAAIGSFVFFSLSVMWAFWMNRLRTSAPGRSQVIQT